jgi:hypothetical protein
MNSVYLCSKVGLPIYHDGWIEFALVNYLPVAPVHEPGCQLVNHVARVQLDSVDTEPVNACNAVAAPGGGCPALGACER